MTVYIFIRKNLMINHLLAKLATTMRCFKLLMVEQAVARMLAEGKTKTTDLGGTALTSDVAEAVIKNLA